MVKRITGGRWSSPRNSSEKSLDPEELRKRIQRKAYELYEKRGATGSNDWADWFEAEKIVRSGRD